MIHYLNSPLFYFSAGTAAGVGLALLMHAPSVTSFFRWLRLLKPSQYSREQLKVIQSSPLALAIQEEMSAPVRGELVPTESSAWLAHK